VRGAPVAAITADTTGYHRRVSTDVAGEDGLAGAAGEGVAVSRPTRASVARGVTWQALGVVLGQGSWYASLFVLAVLLPPRDFGVIAVASATVSVVMLALESGISGALIIAPEIAAGSVWKALVRTSVAGILVAGLFAGLAGPIAGAFAGGTGAGVLRVVALTVALAAVAIVPNALLMRNLRFKAASQITIAAAVAASAAAIVAAALGAGIWSLVIRLLVNQALIAVLAFVACRDLLPRRPARGTEAPRTPGSRAFLVIAAANALAWTCDNLVVGASTDAARLGVYALAFSLAFLPLTQVSWAVGQVVLPAIAAARGDEEAIRAQTLTAVRVMALALLPVVPVAVALAPGVIPAVLGHRWDGLVVVFQILVGAGVGYAVLNILAEALAGAGARSAGLRARIDASWALLTIAAIAVGVRIDGIRGAAIAHLVTCAVLAVAYAWRGGRGIGLSPRALIGAVRQVAVCVLLQAAATAGVVLALEAASVGKLGAGIAGTAAGIVVFAGALRTLAPAMLEEGWLILRVALRRRSVTS
jgi:O-antigen/teichoic acid export membrane protein